MNQLEFESLMMAHDNLQRELSDIKRLIGKDKHELIKANIALNKRVQELENANRVLKKANIGSERAKERLRNWIDEFEIENERYREALEFYADEETYETKFATDTDETFDPFTLIELDEGKKARKALEGDSDDEQRTVGRDS